MVVLKKKHIRTCSLLAGGIVTARTFFAGNTGEGAATLTCKYNGAVSPLHKLHAQVEEEIKICIIFLTVVFIIVSVLPTEYIGVIRGIFIASALFWITGSFMSAKKTKTE